MLLQGKGYDNAGSPSIVVGSGVVCSLVFARDVVYQELDDRSRGNDYMILASFGGCLMF